MKTTTARCIPLVILSVVIAAGCDKVPLVAPVASTISAFASETSLAPGGTAVVSAYVVEEAGTPVQNGTQVMFFTNLGLIEPASAQTKNGVASTTFTAGNTAGTARITAVSGGATGAADQPNTVEIVIN